MFARLLCVSVCRQTQGQDNQSNELVIGHHLSVDKLGYTGSGSRG